MNNESQNSIISENTEMIGSVNVKVELQNSDIQSVTPKLQKKVYRQLIQTAVLKVLGNPVDRTNLPMDVELSKPPIWNESDKSVINFSLIKS